MTRAIKLSEHQEQSVFVKWCRVNGIATASVPNGFFVPTKNQRDRNRLQGQIAKLKKEGYAPGFPDLMVFIEGKLLLIEMKVKEGGVVSDNQKKWHGILKDAGFPVFIAHGADMAIEHTMKYFYPGEVSNEF